MLHNNSDIAEEIYQSEIESINQRRKNIGLEAIDRPGHQSPSPRHKLVGLAISGGGIRSATFSQGVLQNFCREEIFKNIDYMSTVSGGGYTGSMISSLMNDPVEQLPINSPIGEQEPAPLKHLRHGSNYLSPGGLLDAIRLPAVLIRGIILNLLLSLPYLMLAVVITELLHEPLLFRNPFFSRWIIDYPAMAISIIAIFVYFIFVGIRGLNWSKRDAYEKLVASFIFLITLSILVLPLIHGINAAIEIPWSKLIELRDSYLQKTGLLFILMLILSIVLLIRASKDFSRLLSRIAIYSAGILGPAVIYFIYLLMLVAQVDSPYINISEKTLKTLYDQCENTSKTGCQLDTSSNTDSAYQLITALHEKGIRQTAGTVILSHCQHPESPGIQIAKGLPTIKNPWSMKFESPVSYQLLFEWSCQKPGKSCNRKNLCNIPDGQVEDRFIRLLPATNQTKITGAKLRWGGEKSELVLLDDHWFLSLLVTFFILNHFLIHVNRSSLHGFYRDRLSRLYLIRWIDGKLIANDEQKLSNLNKKGSSAPYHIINTTLNLQGVNSGIEQYRNADFFMFSKNYCGSQSTGYCQTEKLEAKDSHINLGTAMAISAAAAAPNMGSTTVTPLVFIMTLFNFRLGYWVPNPDAINHNRHVPLPRMRYLFKEAMGKLDHLTPLVNVSDGGHLENLGIYELLRRRCKLIIAIDGEADPEHSFGGLITLIRLCKIDMGINIDINLEPLHLQNGQCQSQYTIADIDYGTIDGEPQKGKMVYIKLSYVKGKNDFLQKYKQDHADFPHETTADQFFDEEQFEAYRALGYEISAQLTADDEFKEIINPET